MKDQLERDRNISLESLLNYIMNDVWTIDWMIYLIGLNQPGHESIQKLGQRATAYLKQRLQLWGQQYKNSTLTRIKPPRSRRIKVPSLKALIGAGLTLGSTNVCFNRNTDGYLRVCGEPQETSSGVSSSETEELWKLIAKRFVHRPIHIKWDTPDGSTKYFIGHVTSFRKGVHTIQYPADGFGGPSEYQHNLLCDETWKVSFEPPKQNQTPLDKFNPWSCEYPCN